MSKPQHESSASSGKARVFHLSTLDQIMDRNYTTFIFWFRLPDNADIYDVFDQLRRGMALTLTEIPLLAGRIKTVDEERNFVQIEVTERVGLPMTMRNLSSQHGGESEKWMHGTLDQLERRNFPNAAQNDPLLRPPELQRSEGAPAMVVQCTFIDGGMALYVAKSHTWCDASAGMCVYNLWCKNMQAVSRGEQITVKELPAEAFERSRLSDAPALDLPIEVPDVEEEDTSFGGPDPSKQINWVYSTWFISAAKIKALKQYASPTSGDSWISSGDAINALFWRSISLANNLPKDEEKSSSKAAIAVDFRARLVPKIPKHYIGNAATVLTADLDTEEVCKEGREGLQDIALKLRDAVTSWDAESEVPMQIGMLNTAKNLSRIQREAAMKAYTGPDVLFADHSRTGCYYFDFGATVGLPLRMRELPQYGLARPVNPIVNVYPFDRSGNAEIKTTLEPKTVQAMINDPVLREWIDLVDTGFDESGRSVYKARL